MTFTIVYRKGLKKQKEVLRELKEMFNASSIFEIDSTTNVLMVWFIYLKQYEYVHEILILFAYVQSFLINVHAGVLSETRGVYFSLSLYLYVRI